MPFGPRGGGDEGSVRIGNERAVYTRTGVAGDIVTIQKRYELNVPATQQSQTAITLAGSGAELLADDRVRKAYLGM